MGRPITIELPDDVYEPLSRVALEEGRRPEEVASDWLKLAAQREVDDPLLKLLGSLESDASDLGERHDHYLSEGLMREAGRGEA
jgi:hypothetical protein